MFSVTEEAVGVHLLTVICFVNPMSLQNAQISPLLRISSQAQLPLYLFYQFYFSYSILFIFIYW